MRAEKMKLGVLGASRIVGKALVEPAHGLAEVVAIAARDAERASRFAQIHSIERSYGSYAELLEDPQVEAVYVALPSSEHAVWSIKALQAGKHVLCEKPFALAVDDAERAVRVADDAGLILMEAHHWRYHPLVPVAEAALGQVGEVKSLTACFTGGLNNPDDIRLQPALGPGVVMDFGCYLLQWANWAMGATANETPPGRIVEAKLVLDSERAGVDLAASIQVDYGGSLAVLEADMRDGTPFRSFLHVEGSRKTIHFENPLFVDGATLKVTEHDPLRSLEPETIHPSPLTSTYREQLKAFLRAVDGGQRPLTSGENIIETQRILDEVYRVAGVVSRSELRSLALSGGA